MTDAQNIQDHPLDESTGIQPQHFDADGYVVGAPHHVGMNQGDVVEHDARLIRSGAAPRTNEFGSVVRPVVPFDRHAH